LAIIDQQIPVKPMELLQLAIVKECITLKWNISFLSTAYILHHGPATCVSSATHVAPCAI